MSDVVKATFYRGRPTRGAHLKPMLTILYDRARTADGERACSPLSRDADGIEVWCKRGLHRVERRINPEPW